MLFDSDMFVSELNLFLSKLNLLNWFKDFMFYYLIKLSYLIDYHQSFYIIKFILFIIFMIFIMSIIIFIIFMVFMVFMIMPKYTHMLISLKEIYGYLDMFTDLHTYKYQLMYSISHLII